MISGPGAKVSTRFRATLIDHQVGNIRQFFSQLTSSNSFQLPHRYPMSPPELTGDAPVADVFVPRAESLAVAVGGEVEAALPREPRMCMRGFGCRRIIVSQCTQSGTGQTVAWDI